ncbi:MAG: glycerol-3-phosphate 1-O-acyltransferase PlsY [Candidatus Saganbacteria bacterium]|nr:glycerol-3-phosphate 1-O-acyltransferase PlsY [Candidatus Saganbacteria bacterium]
MTLILVVSYLLGSIPFGYIIGKFYGKDITKEGSGNIGATNAFRLLGTGPGILAFILDLLKGTVAILIAYKLSYGQVSNLSLYLIAAGACAILGHSFSIFMKFRGGKGVAVGLGVLLGLAPGVFIICALWAVLVIAITRYVSAASITGATLATFLMFLFGKPQTLSFFLLAVNILIIIKHKDNITRIINGTERKIGEHE